MYLVLHHVDLPYGGRHLDLLATGVPVWLSTTHLIDGSDSLVIDLCVDGLVLVLPPDVAPHDDQGGVG